MIDLIWNGLLRKPLTILSFYIFPTVKTEKGTQIFRKTLYGFFVIAGAALFPLYLHNDFLRTFEKIVNNTVRSFYIFCHTIVEVFTKTNNIFVVLIGFAFFIALAVVIGFFALMVLTLSYSLALAELLYLTSAAMGGILGGFVAWHLVYPVPKLMGKVFLTTIAVIFYGKIATRKEREMRQKPTLPVEFTERGIGISIRDGKERGTLGTVLSGISARIKTEAEMKVLLKVIEKHKLEAEALKTILDVLNAREAVNSFDDQRTLVNLRYIAEKLSLENQIEDHYQDKALRDAEREAKIMEANFRKAKVEKEIKALARDNENAPMWKKQAEEYDEKIKWFVEKKRQIRMENDSESADEIIEDLERILAENGFFGTGGAGESRK